MNMWIHQQWLKLYDIHSRRDPSDAYKKPSLKLFILLIYFLQTNQLHPYFEDVVGQQLSLSLVKLFALYFTFLLLQTILWQRGKFCDAKKRRGETSFPISTLFHNLTQLLFLHLACLDSASLLSQWRQAKPFWMTEMGGKRRRAASLNSQGHKRSLKRERAKRDGKQQCLASFHLRLTTQRLQQPQPGSPVTQWSRRELPGTHTVVPSTQNEWFLQGCVFASLASMLVRPVQSILIPTFSSALHFSHIFSEKNY